jgi:hypothetical protein
MGWTREVERVISEIIDRIEPDPITRRSAKSIRERDWGMSVLGESRAGIADIQELGACFGWNEYIDLVP